MSLAGAVVIGVHNQMRERVRTVPGGGQEVHSPAGRLFPSMALAAMALMVTADHVLADDLFDYGAYLSSECTTCHRLDGGGDHTIPPIVGWPEDLFIQAIDRYRRGVSTNAIMQNVARSLGDEETAALARFFSQQKNGE